MPRSRQLPSQTRRGAVRALLFTLAVLLAATRRTLTSAVPSVDSLANKVIQLGIGIGQRIGVRSATETLPAKQEHASSEEKEIDPLQLFNGLFLSLACACFVIKVLSSNFWRSAKLQDKVQTKDEACKAKRRLLLSVRMRYLVVWWLFKMADWLKGPYFYKVYISKFPDGGDAMVAKIYLMGFLASAVLSPVAGCVVDCGGRKLGSLIFAVVYAIASLSVHATGARELFAGRILSGFGTALLFCAPESWLVCEHELNGFDSSDLSGTFTLAYTGDAVVAILAGLVAEEAADRSGPTGPFDCSAACLFIGACIALYAWSENRAGSSTQGGSGLDRAGAAKMICNPFVWTFGAIQALFEGSMYIFVLQWPIMIQGVLPGQQVPYGKVFSCFMACCMMGSSFFRPLQTLMGPVKVMTITLLIASLSFAAVLIRTDSLTVVVTAFFIFEVCVGVYFPCISVLRGQYLPDGARGIMMGVFRIPLNLIVTIVIVFIQPSFGPWGSILCSTISLFVAFGALASVLIRENFSS